MRLPFEPAKVAQVTDRQNEEHSMINTQKTVQIAARRGSAPGVVDALFDALAEPSGRLLAFSVSECEGEISALVVAEGSHETQVILETAGFECRAEPTVQ